MCERRYDCQTELLERTIGSAVSMAAVTSYLHLRGFGIECIVDHRQNMKFDILWWRFCQHEIHVTHQDEKRLVQPRSIR